MNIFPIFFVFLFCGTAVSKWKIIRMSTWNFKYQIREISSSHDNCSTSIHMQGTIIINYQLNILRITFLAEIFVLVIIQIFCSFAATRHDLWIGLGIWKKLLYCVQWERCRKNTRDCPAISGLVSLVGFVIVFCFGQENCAWKEASFESQEKGGITLKWKCLKSTPRWHCIKKLWGVVLPDGFKWSDVIVI